MKSDEIANQRVTAAFIWLALAATATYLFLFEPGKSGFFPGCPFRGLTGLACPGCGSTRGLHCLLHGQVTAAFEFNPLLILALPFFLYGLLRYTHAALRGRPGKWPQLEVRHSWMLFAVIVSFWIFRNTPFYPFHV